MFDLNAHDGTVRKKEFQSPIPQGGRNEAPARQVKTNKLDSAPMQILHAKLMGYYTNELDRQHTNRRLQAKDEDFYDNEQWDEFEKQVLAERGQKATVYNVISATVDWVTGTQKRTRADFKILPRRKDEGKPAERKSQLIKYLADVNRTPFHESRAFEDSVKVGVGWLEDAIQDEDEEEPIYTRYESWRNMLWDSTSLEPDLKDARYIFRSKWVDLDIATALFPKRTGLIENSASSVDEFVSLDLYGDDAMDSQENELEANSVSNADRLHAYYRRRVRLIECWFKMPVKARRLKGGRFAGELYDPWSPGHQEAVSSGESEIREKVTMRMHVAIFTPNGLLWVSESPYRHNQFPFTAIWGKRRGKDNMPYGIIRGLVDIQEDINKRASKALHILSTNKIVMEKGAVDDVEELREEAARPDAVIEVNTGKRLDLNTDKEFSQWHLELMGRNISMIQQASGVTDELMGRKTNATSGIAIQRRQDQGQLATATYFDNLRFAKQVRGEKHLSVIEQFVTEEKAFRITNMRGNPEFVAVNNNMPENDIIRSKADYVIDEADWRATIRQAAVDELMEVITRMPPAVGMVLLDLAVENMDIPNREEIVRRIRAVTGQRDPDADELSPEEVAQQEQQAEMDQFNKMALMAELRKKMADAAKVEAETNSIIEKLVGTRVGAQGDALAAAKEALLSPAVAHTADHILSESGFVSQSDREAQAEAEAQQEAEAEHQHPGAPGLQAA